MTEQPKFQRRKRRGADASVPASPARPKRVTSDIQDPTIEELEALIAEKEALLQQKAALEAERLRKAEAEAELARQAERERKAERERQADLERQAQLERDLELERQAERNELRRAREAALEAERQKAALEAEEAAEAEKPKTPLVLAQPVDTHDVSQTSLIDPEVAWKSIDRFNLDPQRLAERNVITALRHDPSHTRFDILRTRMLQALSENGWKRVAITSPTKDCGKTFTTANLAVSLSRQENCRTVVLDFDMRSPSLHKIFGVTDTGSIGDMLRGEIDPEAHLQGFAPNSISAGSHVAFGFNGIVEPYAAELLQDPSTHAALDEIEDKFDPDVMIFDLPPALLNDDVIAMRPHIDALLIVAAGGITKAKDIKETELRLGQNTPLLGVILNKAEHTESSDYSY